MVENKSSFDKQSFANLLMKAKGSRTMTKFAEDAGMSVAHISRMANQKLEAPPSPETIKKLVPKEFNGVTYEDLMIAAGHISAPAIEQLELDLHDEAIERNKREYILPLSSCEEQVLKSDQEKRWEFERMQEREARKRFESMCLSIIMSHVSNCPFKWRIENSKVEQPFSFIHDLQVLFFDAPVETWEFDFKHFRSRSSEENHNSRISPGFAFTTWGRLAMFDIPNNYKYSIVTDSRPFFESLIRRYPKNLDINISVILVDIDEFKILTEEYVAYNHEADIEGLEKLRLADNNPIY